MIIKKIKKSMAAGLAALLVFGVTSKAIVMADGDYVDPLAKSLYITPGEYDGKPGKRAEKSVVEKANVPSSYKRYSDGGVGEFHINKPIVDKIVEYVTALDRSIIVVKYEKQDEKEDLGKSGKRAASMFVDMYIALHTNFAGTSKATGTEVFAPREGRLIRGGNFVCDVLFGDESAELAKAIAGSININNTGIPLHGNNGASINNTTYDEINHAATKMPAVIIEAGFALSNPDELHKLTNEKYINTMAMEIAKAVVKELNSSKYDKDQDFEINPPAKKEESSEEKEEEIKTEVPEEAPVEEISPEKEEVKEELPVIEESIEETKDAEDIEEIKSGVVNVYVKGKAYEVELDTEKKAEDAVSEFNDTTSKMMEKYGIEMED